MKPCSRPSPPLSSGFALALAALLTAGCVSLGRYDEVVDERDALLERVSLLEASRESLDAERVRLIDEMEDLRQRREALETDLVRLRRVKQELSQSLAEREAELAARQAEVERLRSTYEGLVSDLEAELAAGEIEIRQLREGLQLDLAQDILFASGSAVVNASGRVLLDKVAQRVRKVPYLVVVQGHTDNVPVRKNARFASNWELAAARASHVVRILATQGVPPERLSAVSFGEYAPRASNGDPTGRARNRRIEIVLKPLPDATQKAAGPPVAASASTSPGP